MAKATQGTSAAQRRERERAQRNQQIQNQRRTRGRRSRPQKKNSTWWVIGGIIVLIVAVVGIIVWQSNRPQATVSSTVTNNTFNQLTHIDANVSDAIGSGSVDTNVSQILKASKSGTPVLKGPNGKPEIFYMGAEYCPYCAAQRWSMIIALSHFGTFSKPLTAIKSSEDNIMTYSFYQGSYTSNYIYFDPKEVQDNQQSPQNLQSLTSQETQLVTTYDAPPYTSAQSANSYPFLDVANQYVSAGSYASPDLFMGSSSYDSIFSQIKNPTTDLSRGVLGAANYMTAEICQVTQNQPANVCTDPAIQQIEQKLPKASASSGNTQLAAASNTSAIDVRRKAA